MSDIDPFASDEVQAEAPPQAQPGQATDWEQEAKKAFAERDKARAETRRMAITTEFGADIAELIPETLPPTEWKGYAEKLQALRGEQKPNQAAEANPEEPAEQEPPADQTPQEQRLATVVGQASGVQSSASAGDMTGKQLMDLYKTDPAEATRRAIAKYRENPRGARYTVKQS